MVHCQRAHALKPLGAEVFDLRDHVVVRIVLEDRFLVLKVFNAMKIHFGIRGILNVNVFDQHLLTPRGHCV